MKRPRPASPNFGFLVAHDELLVALGSQAERYFTDDPVTCLMKLRQFGEVLAQRVAASTGAWVGTAEQQLDLLNRLRDRGILPREVAQLFHDLRRAGNAATHDATGSHSEALHQLKMARQLAVWFHRTFGNAAAFSPGPFIPPAAPDSGDGVREELEKLRAALHAAKLDAQQAKAAVEAEARARLSAEERVKENADELEVWQQLAKENEARLNQHLAAAQASAAAEPAAELAAVIERGHEASEEIELDEAATRHLIDAQLRAAGWEVDSKELRYSKGVRPQKGRFLAIAEWPTPKGPADYVLFAGLEALGVVEAKRNLKDVPHSIQQAKRYSEGFSPTADAQTAGGPWGKYRVPFLFATNGRPYLKQLETKSGIWFLDGRRSTNLARALNGWISPDGLRKMLQQDEAAATEALRNEPTDYLQLRPYQVEAIKAIEAALAKGQRQVLVAMATGTGKTRTLLGLIYRVIKTGRFRRALFLVDRTSLGDQAAGVFSTTVLEQLQTFAKIYGIKELQDAKPDPETKLHFATVQGLVKRILFPSSDEDRLSVDDYDLIVVDEAHRGYTLDREMSDTELGFRNQADYISKFRRVLEHFDAVKIGLTATPALHTTEIFGKPVFEYSYREAVVDGFLVDHEPPYRIITELSAKGIHYDRGATTLAIEKPSQRIKRITMEDELDFDVETFNRKVVTESFNRVVCEELAKHIDPRLDGKTIVFCANDEHADLFVKLLKEAFANRYYGGIDDDAVMKITGRSDQPMQLIRRFKNEKLPNVAVTVDLLSTGIDVPEVTNIVFVRRVRSRILYEQMLGRGTRLCDAIGKEVFRIFDAVDLYATLEPYTSMQPVVPNPNYRFTELVEQFLGNQDEDVRIVLLEQMVSRLRRKKALIEEHHADVFEAAAGQPIAEFIEWLKEQAPDDVAKWFRNHVTVPPLVDRALRNEMVIISSHPDRLDSVERGYGAGRTRPEDYIESFGAFLRENMNKLPALKVVVQRPRELTRKQLKELKLALDAVGFTEASLQTAYRETTNQDIAASIVGFIRQKALGEPLVPYTERVEKAVKSVLSSRPFTAPQRKWLERIGKQLRNETVVDREALDRGGFETSGGFPGLNKTFDGKLEEILGDLNDALWKQVS